MPSIACSARGTAQPIGESHAGATVALANVAGHRVAYVADEDSKATLTLDLDTRAEATGGSSELDPTGSLGPVGILDGNAND